MITKEKIEEVKNKLIKVYSPLSIYIFGSYAWGDPTPDSDLDLLIVVNKLKKNRAKLLSEGHLALFGSNISKDILLYSKEEFEKSSNDKTSLSYKIKNEGKEIYAKA